jgi:hypothetical protein
VAVRPDGKGFMTGGADQRVTFWDFVVRKGPGSVYLRINRCSLALSSL